MCSAVHSVHHKNISVLNVRVRSYVENERVINDHTQILLNFTKFFIIITHITSVVPKDMSNFFLHANWEQQAKESAVVDGTSCCVFLECLVTSKA